MPIHGLGIERHKDRFRWFWIDFGKGFSYIDLKFKLPIPLFFIYLRRLWGFRGYLMGYVDLHLHTTASDGVMSPSEIVRYAKAKGLQAIAITDHDTIEGVEEGLSEGERIGLEVIPGIEISAEHSPGSMHLLGYFFNIHHPLLKERLAHLQGARAERNPKIVEKLNRLGIKVSYEEVAKRFWRRTDW